MILLDYKDRRPIYEQVVEKLQDLMICGVLEQDSQLPSVRSLATDFSLTIDFCPLIPTRYSGLTRNWNDAALFTP